MSNFLLITIFFLFGYSPVSANEIYTSQQECEQKTGRDCSFQMCDYIPEGKTFEEVCGKDFKKGWAPSSQKILTVDQADRACESDSDCIMIPTHCGGCSCGESVNKRHQEKYQKEFELLCKNFYGAYCDYHCPRSFAACILQQCTLAMPNKDQK